MKIMAFGDIHFHHTHRFSHITDSGFTVRELEHLSCADTLIRLYQEEHIDKLVCLGDIWGPVGDIMSAQTLKAILDFFNKFNEAKISMDVILGNHDLVNNNLKIHKLEALNYLPNIKLHIKPEEVEYLCGGMHYKCVYMPYHLNDDEAIRFLESIENKQNKIVFSHLELGGINLGNGIVTQKGVPLDLLNQFKMTLQGHYHSGNSYGHKIQIAGSTQRLSFKDKGIARRNILIYDTETDKVERRSFECPDWLSFNDDNIEGILKVDNNNYVDVNITTDILLTDEIKKKIDQMKGKNVHVDINRISINKTIETDLNSTDNLDVIKQFVNKSENTEEQKEALINEGKRLLDKIN